MEYDVRNSNKGIQKSHLFSSVLIVASRAQWLTFAEPKLQSTMIAMFAACKEIAYKIRTASCDKMACFNEFGDEQLAIDVLANNVIFENLKASGCCATASSEETPVEDPMGGEVSFQQLCLPMCLVNRVLVPAM